MTNTPTNALYAGKTLIKENTMHNLRTPEVLTALWTKEEKEAYLKLGTIVEPEHKTIGSKVKEAAGTTGDVLAYTASNAFSIIPNTIDKFKNYVKEAKEVRAQVNESK
jgi:hypothetical protein